MSYITEVSTVVDVSTVVGTWDPCCGWRLCCLSHSSADVWVPVVVDIPSVPCVSITVGVTSVCDVTAVPGASVVLTLIKMAYSAPRCRMA